MNRCPHCGARNQTGVFCFSCGLPVDVVTTTVTPLDPADDFFAEIPEPDETTPVAPVSARIFSWLIDAAVFAALTGLPSLAFWVTRHPDTHFPHSSQDTHVLCATPGPVGYTICSRNIAASTDNIYHIFFLVAAVLGGIWLLLRLLAVTSPRKQGSFGMRVLGIRIVTTDGLRRVGIVRSTLRTVLALALWVSVVGLLADILVAAFDADHRTVHDLLAGTVAIRIG